MTTEPTNWRMRYCKMFSCDTARISRSMGMMFLIIGKRRNTRDDTARWFRNGEPFDFDYVQERLIASGATHAKLLNSVRRYKRTCVSR
jgi:hypothetical protein